MKNDKPTEVEEAISACLHPVWRCKCMNPVGNEVSSVRRTKFFLYLH